MNAAPSTEALVCPACGYDVSRTITDGFGDCPECGGAIDARVCWEAGQADGGARKIRWYLGMCCAAPVLTYLVAAALGPAGLGDIWPPFIALGVIAGYAGGTVCVLGWPTGAGWVVERCVRRQQAGVGCAVFAGMLVLGGVLMVSSTMLVALAVGLL
ncbi:MAG: hypothetical protein AAGH64_05420 [Planctomycetota bacterium]